ncbi:hypothetical protein [Bradyrhizobium manausense]|uniref:hypothetical protein n=1 Tax=Bradyrhizobium manausense TaxID=989370 RepID=UPI001BAE52A9|nr:hypothetical protein [Bradyrhizobium manausense]MBR0725305.1 hypothetical protein [Bradyrhizobium manausense]
MKSTFYAVIAICVFASEAMAAGCGGMVCNNNPTCQSLRNAGNCEAARAAGGMKPNGTSGKTAGECRQQVGFTQAQWEAGQTTKAQRRAWDRCMGR